MAYIFDGRIWKKKCLFASKWNTALKTLPYSGKKVHKNMKREWDQRAKKIAHTIQFNLFQSTKKSLHSNKNWNWFISFLLHAYTCFSFSVVPFDIRCFHLFCRVRWWHTTKMRNWQNRGKNKSQERKNESAVAQAAKSSQTRNDDNMERDTLFECVQNRKTIQT